MCTPMQPSIAASHDAAMVEMRSGPWWVSWRLPRCHRRIPPMSTIEVLQTFRDQSPHR